MSARAKCDPVSVPSDCASNTHKGSPEFLNAYGGNANMLVVPGAVGTSSNGGADVRKTVVDDADRSRQGDRPVGRACRVLPAAQFRARGWRASATPPTRWRCAASAKPSRPRVPTPTSRRANVNIQPMITVCATSSRFYQPVLDARSRHGGKQYEQTSSRPKSTSALSPASDILGKAGKV